LILPRDLVHAQGRKAMTTTVSCDTAMPTGRFQAVKARQQSMWASGDYAVIGNTLQIVGELLSEAADVRSVHRVLDVAAGNGNATLAAARRFASVTSTDYVPALLERGRQRAEAEGLSNVRFEVADAEALPYPDASFDVVLSSFGVMFAPDHERIAAEMSRVCRSGGRIGLASWTPEGFVGQLFRLVARFMPPPAGVASPVLWGTDAHVRELFPGATRIEHTSRLFAFRYRSPEHWVDVFRRYYGPTYTAFLALDPDRQAALEADLMALLRSHSLGGEGLVVPGEYLETVITK
jgi:SAM-dependent methyltransferase